MRKAQNAIAVSNLSVRSREGRVLISNVSCQFPHGSVTAIIGPSGSGKSTLLRAIAGLTPIQESSILFDGEPLSVLKERSPLAVSYLPQFSTVHANLTVRETLKYSAALKLTGATTGTDRESWLTHITEVAGITPILDQQVSTLSGGQLRRVSLADELVGNPKYLLLDELTTGLDTFSDGEVLKWLKCLSRKTEKTVLIVTHATEHLHECDLILLMKEGKLISFDNYPNTLSFYGIDTLTPLFDPSLRINLNIGEPTLTPLDEMELYEQYTPVTTEKPSFLRQFMILIERQACLLKRDSGAIITNISLILIFPLIVAIFALEGLPQTRDFGMHSPSIVRELEHKLLDLQNRIEISSLISGITLFQVVLLTLLGANNAAREIAKEKNILRKEFYSGLSPGAYTCSKVSYISVLSVLQSFWMACFVKLVCGIPGSFSIQFGILFLTLFSVGVTCLCISASASSLERASLLSIYLVGFQLPLSGATLSLPQWLADLLQPTIAAYWGWSGYLRSLADSSYYEVVASSSSARIAELPVAVGALTLQATVSLLMLWILLRGISVNRF